MTATLESPTKTATLAERLLAITAELQDEGLTPTGRSPFSKDKALSIGDVESAITPLLVKHGVLITFDLRHLIAPHDGVREWVAEVTGVVSCSPDKEQRADWGDCGSSPAAAFSFARKSFLKMLFHIATTADDAHSDAPQAPAPRNEPKPGNRVKVLETIDTGRFCPDCGESLVIKRLEGGKSFIGCKGYPACKHTEPVETIGAVEDPDDIPF